MTSMNGHNFSLTLALAKELVELTTAATQEAEQNGFTSLNFSAGATRAKYVVTTLAAPLTS